jgi:spore germination cell wall hydrolase CwlJ-like protein
MAAVASVIRNRLAAGGYGRTPSEIVHAPSQFEAWNPPSGTGPALTADPKSSAYRQAAALAQGVFRGVIQDQTGGATHFFAPVAQHALGREAPGWASGSLAEIGGALPRWPLLPVLSVTVWL